MEGLQNQHAPIIHGQLYCPVCDLDTGLPLDYGWINGAMVLKCRKCGGKWYAPQVLLTRFEDRPA
jgi:hypothetical protein